MESLNQKRSLIDEDANISLFRRRNKLIIIVFLFLIISSALIIAALIVEILRIHSASHAQIEISPIRTFCSVSDSQNACLYAFNRILNNKLIIDPDQILTISLSTSVSQIQNFINSSDSACSDSLSHAQGQLGGALAVMRVYPFVSSLSHDQREEIGEQIIAAGEDVKACIDQLAAGGVAAPEKLVQVEVYLNGCRDFLFRHAVVLGTIFETSERSLIYDHLFEIVMCGLQVVFMFGMFFALFRIR